MSTIHFYGIIMPRLLGFRSLEEERKRQEENKMSKRAIVGAIEAVVEHKSQMQVKRVFFITVKPITVESG